jgi:hypothetical protein
MSKTHFLHSRALFGTGFAGSPFGFHPGKRRLFQFNSSIFNLIYAIRRHRFLYEFHCASDKFYTICSYHQRIEAIHHEKGSTGGIKNH